jgi:hypothetical protein
MEPCFSSVAIPDAYAAMDVVTSTGCILANYYVNGYDDVCLSIDVINGVFITYLGRSVHTTIDISLVDMYMFWLASFDKCKYALPSEAQKLAITSYKLTNGGISINGEDIKPYCDFSMTGSNIWLQKYTYSIYSDPFIALSAAINGDNLLY